MTEQIRAAHILVESRAEAEEIISILDTSPDLQQTFAELAFRRSTCNSFQQGGDLGFFGRGQMHKTFEDMAYGLGMMKYNRIPVQTPFGWHVICRIS
jgi:parvulin-like peptidyl-prolyl isomerase